MIGRSPQKRGPFALSRSLVDRLNELASDLDIYIIPNPGAAQQRSPRRRHAWQPQSERFSVADALKTLGILALCTGVSSLFQALGLTMANAIMVYILGVLCVSMITTGCSYSLLASLLSVLIFNFFFTYPYFTLISDPSYVATFGVMFLVGILGSSMTIRIKRQAVQSSVKAYRTEVLLETSQKLRKSRNPRVHSGGCSHTARQAAGTRPAAVSGLRRRHIAKAHAVSLSPGNRHGPLSHSVRAGGSRMGL